MTATDPLKDTLSEMAVDLLKEAMTNTSGKDAVPLNERVQVFNAVTRYFAMINKLDLNDDDKKGAYDGYRSKITAADRGGTAGRGNGSARQ